MADKPVVDVEFLAKCLGINPADMRPETYLQNWQQCYTARVITDAHRPYQPGNRMLVEIAIPNGEAWISKAYEKGVLEGRRRERKEWEGKIRSLFGLSGGDRG